MITLYPLENSRAARVPAALDKGGPYDLLAARS